MRDWPLPVPIVCAPETQRYHNSQRSHRISGHAPVFWHTLLGICLAGTICGLSLGCASQSPPRPPRVQRPEAVRNLSALQVGTLIEIHFTLPDTATDGQGLTKPLEIDILRAETYPGGKPGPAVIPTPWVTLQGAALAAHTSAGKVEYRDSLDGSEFRRLVGGALTYQVRGLTRGFRGRPIGSALSNAATLQVLDVPEPPSGLAVEATSSALRLRWSAPTQTVSGKALGAVGLYRIDRSETGRAGAYHPVGESHDEAFSDASFEFGHPYAYRVRALVTESGQTAESTDSASVEIVPRDVFPPATPAGLTGLYTAAGVELIWSPNTEPDLAGYNVYRGSAGQQPTKLNADLLRSPLFHDTSVASGGRYTYRVTAVDLNGNESLPSGEISVDVP
jgi:hypothetical protein